jgi:hypothetical protein
LILVDDHDHRPCDLRCARSSSYCARYPGCLAGVAHRLLGTVNDAYADRVVVHEDYQRSELGGRSRSRVLRHLGDGTEIEEVELYCTTVDVDTVGEGDGRFPSD